MLTATTDYELGYQEYKLGFAPKPGDSHEYWRGYFDAYNEE